MKGAAYVAWCHTQSQPIRCGTSGVILRRLRSAYRGQSTAQDLGCDGEGSHVSSVFSLSANGQTLGWTGRLALERKSAFSCVPAIEKAEQIHPALVEITVLIVVSASALTITTSNTPLSPFFLVRSTLNSDGCCSARLHPREWRSGHRGKSRPCCARKDRGAVRCDSSVRRGCV